MTATFKRQPLSGIDTHAHIFRRDLPMVPGRRYSPDYDAELDTYLAHLDENGLAHGVLIQPSFLGTDNSHIEAAIAAHPDRLRGVAVVSPDVSLAELDRLKAAGFAGIRLNLVGKELEDYASDRWQRLFEALGQRGMQVEIQRRFEDFPLFLPAMLAAGVTIVIDHFGLPQGGIDPMRPEHAALLTLLSSPQIWVKLSAPYRSGMDQTAAASSLALLRAAAGGLDRMVWGSDWPHTQHEQETGYADQLAFLTTLLPDPGERQRVLAVNPARLFGFALPQA